MKRGVPNIIMNLDNRAKHIDPDLLPSAAVAIEQYRTNGGNISDPCSFGSDPIGSNTSKKDIRYHSFTSHYSFNTLFCEVSNGCGSSFSSGLRFFIDVTYRLANS